MPGAPSRSNPQAYPFLDHASHVSENSNNSSNQRNNDEAVTASQNAETERSPTTIRATTYTPAPAAGVPVADVADSGNGNQNGRSSGFAVGAPFFSSQLYNPAGVEYYENDREAASRARNDIVNDFYEAGVSDPLSETSNSDLIRFVVGRQLSRAVRLFAIISIIDILFGFLLLFGSWFFVFVLFGPALGWHGARFFKLSHVLCYLVFCVAIMSLRVATFFLYKNPTVKVLQFIMFFVEVYITRLVYKFSQFLRTFSEEELQLLRILENPTRSVYWSQQHDTNQAPVVIITQRNAGGGTMHG